jgi:biopolymer transport protein ExbB
MGDILGALNPFAAFAGLRDFMETGGYVLYIIAIAAFVMWLLIVERMWYYATTFRSQSKQAVKHWNGRTDQKSWYAHRIREQMISAIRIDATSNLGLIKTLVAVAPMLGLLGTVTGMIEVFDVMALTGASNARALASGVSKATLPTMAGMVVALSGIYMISFLERRAQRNLRKLEDQMALN